MVSRIIGIILIKDNIAVQSINFKNFLPLGRPETILDHLVRWGIDEVVLLDISRDLNFNERFYKNLKNITEKCNIPVTVGGGIKNLNNAKFILSNGGDKIIVNSEFFVRPEIIKKMSRKFGKQSVILSLDVKKVKNKYALYSNNGRKKIDLEFKTLLKNLYKLEVGEVLINSIDRDGSKKGYDLDLLKLVRRNASIPVNFAGGVGKKEDFIKPIKYKISGICCGNYFNFKENSVGIVKDFLSKKFKKNIRYKY